MSFDMQLTPWKEVMMWDEPRRLVRNDARRILEDAGLLHSSNLSNSGRRVRNTLVGDAVDEFDRFIAGTMTAPTRASRTLALVQSWSPETAHLALNEAVNTYLFLGMLPFGDDSQATQAMLAAVVVGAVRFLNDVFQSVHEKLDEDLTVELKALRGELVAESLQRAWCRSTDPRAKTAALEVARGLSSALSPECAQFVAALLEAGHSITDVSDAVKALRPDDFPQGLLLVGHGAGRVPAGTRRNKIKKRR